MKGVRKIEFIIDDVLKLIAYFEKLNFELNFEFSIKVCVLYLYFPFS